MPEKTLKRSIIARATSREAEASGRYNRVSSAYKEIISRRGPTDGPGTSGEDRSRIARGSSVKANSPEDNGQPCLGPLPRANCGDRIPFVLTSCEAPIK